MTTVIADVALSLDGYGTAPGPDKPPGLGIDGKAIHAWVREEPRSPVDQAMPAHSVAQTGAVVMGRRLVDSVDGPHGWNDPSGDGHDQNQSAAPPCVVITHEPPAQVRIPSRFQAVTDGVASAGAQARAAGEKDVVVLLNRAGPTTLIQREVTASPWATHLTDEIVRDERVAGLAREQERQER